MRKAYIIGLPVLALAAASAGFVLLHHSDPIGNGRQRMARNDMRGAEIYLHQAVREHPTSAEAAFLLGQVDLALGNPEAAELELRRARDRGWDPAAIVLPLGQAYLQQRHFEAALRDFDPGHAPPGTLSDVLTIRAAAQLSLGQTDQATASSAAAERAAPDKRETLLTAARIALARDDLDGAAQRAAHILKLAPGDADALLLQAEIAMRHNDANTALARAQTVLSASPGRLDARLLEARALSALGRIEAARASVQQVLRGAAKNISANYLGAMLAIQLGDYAGADSCLTQISTVLDRLPRGFYFMGIAKLGVGQPAQAEEAVTKFLARTRDDPAGLKLLAFIDLARQHPAPALALLQQGPLAAHPDSDTFDLIGRAQAMSGNMKAAKDSFAAATKLAPKDTAILNRLAAAHLDLGDTQAAEADLHRSLEIAPAQRLAGEALVQADLSRGDIAAATAGIEHLRHELGDAEEVGVLAAQVKIAALDLDGAEAQLRDVLDRFPDSRPATMNLVRIEGLRGNQEAAEKLLSDWLRNHPGDEGALDILLPALLADKKLDRAVAEAESAHTAAPDNPNITAALAGTYVRAHQTGRAAALLDRASAETNPQLDLLRARVLMADGKLDQAEDAYRATLREKPADLRSRADLAALLVSRKRYDDAREVLQDGLQQSPGNPVLLGATVGVDLKEGGIKQALAKAAALRADPQNLPAANALAGDAWLTAGDRKEAAAAFLAAYKSAPSGDLAVKAASALSGSGETAQAIAVLQGWSDAHKDDAAAHSLLSALYIGTNQLAAAERQMNAVLALRHDDTATLNNLAWVKQQQGDKAAAKSLAERAYYQTPGPEIADTLGWILAQQGDARRALALLAQAVANPQPAARAAAQYHYGYTLNATGRAEEARAQLQKAVNAEPEFPEKEDARRLLATLH